jgi:hypothetical protein
MRLRGVAVAGLLIALAAPAPTSAANEVVGPPIGGCAAQQQGAVDQLPDLKMAPLYGVYIKTTATGHKRLRFGTISKNLGDGPLEVRGENRTGDTITTVAQRIYDNNGGCRDVLQPNAHMDYAGDGHNHWHVNEYMVSQLYRKSGVGSTLRIRKLGFCLLDFHQLTNPPPNAPPDRVYWNGVCGDETSQQVAMGISVGYADDYGPTLAYQWIDVTGLPTATYRLCTGVNPYGWWLEKGGVGTNNYYWYDLKLSPSTNGVTIMAHGRSACLK